MGQDYEEDRLGAGVCSSGPNVMRNTSQGEWRPERPFPSFPARCGRDRMCDTEPLFNPAHPGHPVLQLPLQSSHARSPWMVDGAR